MSISIASTIILEDGQHDIPATPATVNGEKVIFISFEPKDPENPYNWSKSRKWICVAAITSFASITAINVSSYASGIPSMQKEWPGTTFVECIGANALHLVIIAFAPMIIAPISENLGRKDLFILSALLNFLCFIPQALAPHISVIYVARMFQGIAGSAGNSLSGGLIADIFTAKNRGHAMACLTTSIICGQAIGGIMGGWIAQELGFRWLFWVDCIIACIIVVMMIPSLKETRGAYILIKRAKALTKKTGIVHKAAGVEGGTNVKEVLRTTVVRPFILLLTEPIVLFFSLWAGLIWGILTMLYVSVPIVWTSYGFSQGLSGTTFIFMLIGGVVGFITNMYQEKLYHRSMKKHNGFAAPEARLYLASISGIVFPTSLFWYAWTGRPSIHWMSGETALFFSIVAIYHIYLSIFTYLADVYEQYGSSALAAQSLLRNLFAAFFPMFAKTMYENMGPPIASTLLASLSAAFSPLPFLLFAFGKQVRAKSKVAQQIKSQGAFGQRPQ